MTDDYAALRNARNPAQFCAVLESIAMELMQGAYDIDCDFGQDPATDSAGAEWRNLAKSLDIVAQTYAVQTVRPPIA